MAFTRVLPGDRRQLAWVLLALPARSLGIKENAAEGDQCVQEVRKTTRRIAVTVRSHTGTWNAAIDLETERHAELPEEECKLVQPLWKTGDIY